MRAAAALAVERGADGPGPPRTLIRRMRSDPPIVLRPTHEPRGEVTPPGWLLLRRSTAHVAVVAGAAGPVGGDHLQLDVDVGSGASLVLRAVAATIALPGPRGDRSRTDVTIRVASHGTLAWLPGTLIAARGCRHETSTTVILEPGARFVLREELILGRHGEQPGSLRQRLRVVVGDRALHDQEVHIGPDSPGWAGPAVTGGRRALGSLLVVGHGDHGPTPPVERAAGDGWARMPLDDAAVLVTAAAHDSSALRGRLDQCLQAIGAAADPGPPGMDDRSGSLVDVSIT